MKIFELTLFWITLAPSYYGLFYALSFFGWYYFFKKNKFFDEKDLDNFITK